ncbi:MAG: hypothetical protein AW09_004254 [Candidatus Accumulibacter phosphatis]|uniref:Uncharacterized protein n=1 Tax=Candidatus Accumulibacter phosphatis TaxID=327160 RepID=A0A080LR64_9PROT|nr:MAG: hypothetical protein AW09_004254 [Candidatus Accumulibacter phosphatis]
MFRRRRSSRVAATGYCLAGGGQAALGQCGKLPIRILVEVIAKIIRRFAVLDAVPERQFDRLRVDRLYYRCRTTGGGRCRAGDEIEVAIGLFVECRLLVVADRFRFLGDRAAHPAHRVGGADSRLRDRWQELAGEQAVRVVVVVAQLVERLLVGARRIENDLTVGRLRRRQTTRGADRARAGLFRQGIVAAGVENEQGELGLGVGDLVLDRQHAHRLVGEVVFAARGIHVDRHQEVLVVDLQAMSSEKENSDPAAGDFLHELVDRQVHLLLADVVVGHHFEADLLEFAGHGIGIVDRLLQLGDVLIVVVADHQRDAPFGRGQRVASGSECENQAGGDKEDASHENLLRDYWVAAAFAGLPRTLRAWGRALGVLLVD